MHQLQTQIEEQIAALDPAVELIALEQTGPEALRLYVDHPAGVDLGLCERVTVQLRDLLADYAFEVSSPGLDRPLTKPEHFQRFVGHRVRVRTAEPIGGRRNFTGRIAAVEEDHLAVEDGDERIEIAIAQLHRSNLVPEPSEVRP